LFIFGTVLSNMKYNS